MNKELSLSDRTAHIAESNIVERLAALHQEIAQGVAAIAGWFRFSAERLIESGKILCEAQELMRGEYEDWFESNAGRVGYSLPTARRYKRIYRNYILRGGDLTKDLQDYKSQQEFLLALGISERSETETSSGGGKSQPIFRLVISAEPEKWSHVERLEFLAKFEEVKKIADRIREIEAAA